MGRWGLRTERGIFVVNELLGIVRSFGVARLAAIVGVTTGVAVALGLIILRIGETPMNILYADLELRDAQSVIERLEQTGVKHDVREQGGRVAILVPRDQTARLKLDLAGDGIIAQSGVGYEIFDQSDAFGATNFQQQINRLRALEGELSRTIASISGVRASRVHLVLPQRELFSRDKKTASASIVVDAPNGLDQRSVKAIINLTASAVPELSPSHITVLDASGALLAAGNSGDGSGLSDGNAEEKTVSVEQRVRRTVEDIVGRIVGEENLRVQVSAEIDFNRVTENSEIIDPDSQTVLSATTVEEISNDVDPALSRTVSVANGLPGAPANNTDNTTSTSSNTRTEETTNYEISRTVRQEVREIGGIKRLSVAVALNAGAEPRDEAQMAQITTLVRSAIGFDGARGDQVDVVEIPFAETANTPFAISPPSPATSSFNQSQLMRLAEVAALGFIALALVFYVLRPMFASPKTNAATPTTMVENASATPSNALPAPQDALEQKIDLARVEGQVKASSLSQVSEVVKGHTDESAGILKSWIREAS